MSEKDLALKVASRRLLWRMGYSTRLDVALRGVAPVDGDRRGARGRRSASPESFTDLDVLGVTIAGGYRIESAIVDCKTSARGSTERMFWVRGVADFFAADAAYMVRETDVSNAARQLASRLRIAALTSGELSRLEALHGTDLALSEAPLDWLFDRERSARVIAAFVDLDARLKPILEYRQFGYWIYEEHRNPLQMVEHLRQVARHLDSKNPRHRALVFDVAWLYLLTLTHAIRYLRSAHMSDPAIGLKEYLLGGPAGLREKQQLSHLLEELRSAGSLPAGVDVEPLPSYFAGLLELVTRIMRRPGNVITALRLLEVLVMTSVMNEGDFVAPQLTGLYDELAAKQAADVIGFLVSSSGIDPDFRTAARHALLQEAAPAVQPAQRVDGQLQLRDD